MNMIRKLFLSIFVLMLSCRFNNPFYPKAEIVLSSNLQTITLSYEISPGQIRLTYPKLQLLFREIYGGTYGVVDSARVDYYYPGSDPIRDSIVKELPPYKAGFFLYIPPDKEVLTEFDLVTDEVENLFAPDKGNFEGPLNATLTFYGKDGNEHNFKLFLTVTLQRVLPD